MKLKNIELRSLKESNPVEKVVRRGTALQRLKEEFCELTNNVANDNRIENGK